MKNNFAEILGKLLLAIFLFSTHSKLFYWLAPDFVDDNYQEFSYLRITENVLQAEIYGLLFGLMTVFILQHRKGSPLFKTFVIIIAILDGLVVQYLYNTELSEELRIWFASSHYSLYAIFIILMYGFAKGASNKMQAIEKDAIDIASRYIAKELMKTEVKLATFENTDEINRKVHQYHADFIASPLNGLADKKEYKKSKQTLKDEKDIIIFELHQKGLNNIQIAQEIGVDQSTVYRRLKKISKLIEKDLEEMK